MLGIVHLRKRTDRVLSFDTAAVLIIDCNPSVTVRDVRDYRIEM